MIHKAHTMDMHGEVNCKVRYVDLIHRDCGMEVYMRGTSPSLTPTKDMSQWCKEGLRLELKRTLEWNLSF